MKSSISLCLLAFLLIAPTSDAIASLLAQKLIVRRQSGETETETTNTDKNNGNSNSNSNSNNNPSSMQPGRLYPDLPQLPGASSMYPHTGPQPPFQPNFHGAPTPFVPFSPQLTPSQLSDLQRRMQPPRPPMSSSERLQSQTFTNGLGRRLLAMIGLDPAEAAVGNETNVNGISPLDPTTRALQNATVLQQLNGGVRSIYGSLSKMYNSTVQQQLNLLQERFKKEAENSTNPWQQRMSQQVPMFFKSMAAKVGEAQENLNRVWQQMIAQARGNSSSIPADASSAQRSANQDQTGRSGFFSSFDRFMNPNGADSGIFSAGGGNFFDQFGRSLGFASAGQQPAPGNGQDLGSQLIGFWHNQVQPQIGMVRGQIVRVWRDLTASGTLMPDPMVMRSRNQFSLGAAAPSSGQAENSSSSSEIVDEILKEVDMNNSEYTLLDSKLSADQQQQPQQPSISSQMQNRLISMQRELNQLWGGLTTSLQNAIGNVRNTLNPMSAQPFGPLTPMASSNNRQEADPQENEISGKVEELGKLQRDADTVQDVLRQQQQQQQRPGFFRSFFNNVGLSNEFSQLPSRFSDSMSRFGTAVGDLWNQIPRRWDDFKENMSPQSEMARARLVAATASPASKATSTLTEKQSEDEATSVSS